MGRKIGFNIGDHPVSSLAGDLDVVRSEGKLEMVGGAILRTKSEATPPYPPARSLQKQMMVGIDRACGA